MNVLLYKLSLQGKPNTYTCIKETISAEDKQNFNRAPFLLRFQTFFRTRSKGGR